VAAADLKVEGSIMAKRASGVLFAITGLVLSSAAWGQARYPELKGLQNFDLDVGSVSEQCGVTKRAIEQALKASLEPSRVKLSTEKKGPRIQVSTLSKHILELNVCATEVTLEVRASVRVQPTNQPGFGVLWSDRRLVVSFPGGVPPRALQAVKELGKGLIEDCGDAN
jgi:hypothetical protein